MQNHREIAALTALVSQMAERLTAAHERLVQTVTSLIQEDRARLAVLIEAQQRTDASIAVLIEAQQRTDASIAALTEAQQRTDASVATLAVKVDAFADGLNELRVQVLALAATQTQTNERLTEMSGRIGAMSGQMSNLVGGQYEKEAARLAPRTARRVLGLLNVTVQHTAWEPGTIVSDAVDSDMITNAEASDLNRIDLVMTGQDYNGDAVQVAAEISITIEPNDVTRSADRAHILHKVTGIPIIATAIGNDATPDAVTLANNRQVAILTIPAAPTD